MTTSSGNKSSNDSHRQPPLERWELDVNQFFGKNNYIIFLLGAGASKDLGMPICRDFFDAGHIELVRKYLPEDSLSFFEEYKSLGIGIEELLARFKEEGDSISATKLLRFYEKVFIASETVAGGLNEVNDKWLANIRYYSFFHSFLCDLRAAGAFPIVMSFNHDIWIERMAQMSRRSQGYNYGRITSRMFNKLFIPSLPKFGYDFTLLKPHGSFNWLLCTDCQNIWCAEDYLWYIAGKRCPACEAGEVNALYIPPYKKKDYHPLADVWQDAEYFLSLANTLIVIGYSLPPYDFEAKELLKSLNPNATLYIVDKLAASVASNYRFVEARSKFIYSCGFRDFMEDEIAPHTGFPFQKFIAIP